MTKVFSVLLVVGALGTFGCSHAPLRGFDCSAVLGLRLGQSPDEVRQLLGPAAFEGASAVSWEGEAVADYVMRYSDWENRKRSWFGSTDEFYVEFFKRRLVVARAYRYGDFARDYEESLGLFLGSSSYGKRPEPVRYHVGPTFSSIFRCPAEFPLDQAKATFVTENTAVNR